MIMDNPRVCSECGSNKTEIGEFKGYGSLFKKNAILKCSEVEACFCMKCGYILFLRVKNPEKIL